eukprot:10892345-Ditylum_brightwellii.AAC.1
MCNKKKEKNKLDHNNKANQNKHGREIIATEEFKEGKNSGDNAPTDTEEVKITANMEMEKNKRDHPASSTKQGSQPSTT